MRTDGAGPADAVPPPPLHFPPFQRDTKGGTCFLSSSFPLLKGKIKGEKVASLIGFAHKEGGLVKKGEGSDADLLC